MKSKGSLLQKNWFCRDISTEQQQEKANENLVFHKKKIMIVTAKDTLCLLSIRQIGLPKLDPVGYPFNNICIL